MICRAEQNAIMLLSPHMQAVISSERYALLEKLLSGEYISGDFDQSYIDTLEKHGFLRFMCENPETVRLAMERSRTVQAPENSLAAPTLLNLELTTRCPLRCPQCYCDLDKGKDLSLDRALEVLRQAAEMGVSSINLSGGETVLYPHLNELLDECSRLGLSANVALSGYGVDINSLEQMIDRGVCEIYVSLNGSTEEISRKTRDGHDLAINALELLCERGYEHTAVNWVAHRSNISDFSNVVNLCEKLGVKKLTVIALKPDSAYSMESMPTHQQTLDFVEDIKRLQKEPRKLIIEVERCYSPLLALLGQKFLFNSNVGISKGCGAGRDGACLNVDGLFTPCRHLDFADDFHTLDEYWHKSEVLSKLRTVENMPEEPCDKCRFRAYCLSCLAVNAKLHNRIVKANKNCTLWSS